ncbi:tetratricopeptide repeat protein [Chondromyces apiculatus]|uniref:PEGA domain-containing protein n=1 Tax=Chondromyces apiculatus DSM 436 TaxID=1192034 RepID=A0A017SXJ2_9BACT|nr:tetratricopeptide repeat protein [Chondromyces apiculatus]EYF01340.1 Hypothetical protein CAP_8382 [Chondromyces apiculatus DSM 436]
MHTRWLVTVVSLSVAFCTISVAPEAQAQSADASLDEREKARKKAEAAADRGLEHYEAGRYDEAITAFSEAHRIYQAPTFLLEIAHAHEKLGHLREARTYYQRVVDEKLTHYAPKVFFETQAQAKTELAALLPRIPTLQVTVTGAPPGHIKLVIDGKATSSGSIALNPGEHTVSARAPRRVPLTRRVMLAEGAKEQLTLTLEPPSKAKPPTDVIAAPAPQAAPAEKPTATGSSSGRSPIPAISAFGLAGVATVVGTVTGLMSFGAVDSLPNECRDKVCYDDAGGDSYDRASTMATISTVSFWVAGVGAAAGVALVLWPSAKDEPAKAALRVSPSWIGVQGSF